MRIVFVLIITPSHLNSVGRAGGSTSTPLQERSDVNIDIVPA